MAENQQLYLYVYAADYLVQWKGEEQYERIKKKYILCPRYAEALRTNPTKNIKYIGKLVNDKLITGTLFRFENPDYIKCGPDISTNNVLILKDQVDEIENGKYIEWIKLTSPSRKKKINEFYKPKMLALNKICLSLSKAISLLEKKSPAIVDVECQENQSGIERLQDIKKLIYLLSEIDPESFFDNKHQRPMIGDDARGITAYLDDNGLWPDREKNGVTKRYSLTQIQDYMREARDLDD